MKPRTLPIMPIALLLLVLLLAQTDYNKMTNDIMVVVISVIPILVLLLVLKLLFKSFGELSKMNLLKRYNMPLLLVVIAQTNQTGWSTNMDLWSTITGLVLLVLPFLVLIIVLRSIFRYFTREW